MTFAWALVNQLFEKILNCHFTKKISLRVLVKIERSDVDYPLWRKKVDSSLFRQNGTTIPQWACRMWEIEKDFSSCVSRTSLQSKVKVEFKGKEYVDGLQLQKKVEKRQLTDYGTRSSCPTS